MSLPEKDLFEVNVESLLYSVSYYCLCLLLYASILSLLDIYGHRVRLNSHPIHGCLLEFAYQIQYRFALEDIRFSKRYNVSLAFAKMDGWHSLCLTGNQDCIVKSGQNNSALKLTYTDHMAY